MKGTQRYTTSAILVALLVVGLVGGVFIAGLKPKLGLDLSGGLSVVLTAPSHTSATKMDEAVIILNNRVNRLGVSGATISREGSNNITVDIANAKDPQQILKIIGETAVLEFRQVLAVFPAGSTETVTPAAQDFTTQTVTDADTSGNLYQLSAVPGAGTNLALTGDAVSGASAVVNTSSGGWSINLSLKSQYNKAWSDFTSKLACIPITNASNPPVTREIGIVLDQVVQSAPIVNSTVACGTGLTSTQITGTFSETDAKNLALVLQTGALPVSLKISTESEISATLGHQSLNAGLIAGALGLLLVLIYVALYYRSLGLQTWVGLMAFGGIIYALVVILSNTLGLSLSLAGIAGLIVSIGITTDSYVVFFERIKEEVHGAKTLRSSVDRGYKSALRTLFTADAITFFAAVILYILAVGDVKGFAFTLGMATALDVFLFMALTYPLAALLSRSRVLSKGHFLGMSTALEGTGQKGWLRKVYRSDFHIEFIGRRKMWLTISGAAVLISALALIPGIRGLHYGIDFKGGTQITAPIGNNVTVPEIKTAIANTGVQPQSVVIASQVGSKTRDAEVVTNNLTNNTTDQSKVVDALASVVGTNANKVSVDSVGASWGSQVTEKAIEALIVFLVVVVLYMSWRLETKMAGAGIIALLHDLIITAGVYAITGLQVTPDTVIAVLTILGYSLYDTVVVFDKIKENVILPSNAKKPYDQIANESMNQVFMRSINTSLTTLLPVGSLLFVGSFLLGADTLRELALALFVGIASGTYSSIFVATPLLSMFKEREPKYASLKAARLRKAKTDGAAAVVGGGGVAVATRTVTEVEDDVEGFVGDAGDDDKPVRRPAPRPGARPAPRPAPRPGGAAGAKRTGTGKPGGAAGATGAGGTPRPPRPRPATPPVDAPNGEPGAPAAPANGSVTASEATGEPSNGTPVKPKPAGPGPAKRPPQRKTTRAKRKKGRR
jgi:SecD/SecF fusion protein